MSKYNDIRNIRVLAFLNAYEKQECLWNPELDSYKNKADRDEAYLKIIQELNTPSITVQDVKLKVKGIRTTYSKELRLLTKHREQGKIYKPKLFWFPKANSFLKNVCSPRHKQTFYLKEEDTSHPDEYKDCTIEYISDGSADDMEETHPNDESTNNIPETTIHSQPVTPTDFKSGDVCGQANTNNEQTQEEQPIEHITLESQCTFTPPIFDSKNTMQTHVACAIQKDDEFDLFCRSVAGQLRSITDSYSRSVAKLKIQQILFEAETGHYKNSPCITIPILPQINS